MPSPLRSRARACLGLALTISLGALPACALSEWGPGASDSSYQEQRERWELPLGLTLLPVALTCDLALTWVISMGLTLANPINWLLVAAGGEPLIVGYYAFPATSVSLTLVNPNCNFDPSWEAPDEMAAFPKRGPDDDEIDRRRERLETPWGSDPYPEGF